MSTDGPYKLTPRVRKLLIEAGSCLLPAVVQGDYAGIDRRLWRIWRARARAGEEPYAGLMKEVHQAEATAQRAHMANIREAGAGQWVPPVENKDGDVITPGRWDLRPNWQASAWALERRAPHLYGMVAAMRPELQEDLDATSAQARKEGLLASFKATRPSGSDTGGDE